MMDKATPDLETSKQFLMGTQGYLDANGVFERALALDERRLKQIANQKASIARLLHQIGVENPDAAAEEITRLNAELAKLQQILEGTA